MNPQLTLAEIDKTIFVEPVIGVISYMNADEGPASAKLALCQKDIAPELFNLFAVAPMAVRLMGIINDAATHAQRLIDLAGMTENRTAVDDATLGALGKAISHIERLSADCRVFATSGLKKSHEMLNQELANDKK